MTLDLEPAVYVSELPEGRTFVLTSVSPFLTDEDQNTVFTVAQHVAPKRSTAYAVCTYRIAGAQQTSTRNFGAWTRVLPVRS